MIHALADFILVKNIHGLLGYADRGLLLKHDHDSYIVRIFNLRNPLLDQVEHIPFEGVSENGWKLK